MGIGFVRSDTRMKAVEATGHAEFRFSESEWSPPDRGLLSWDDMETYQSFTVSGTPSEVYDWLNDARGVVDEAVGQRRAQEFREANGKDEVL